MESVNLSEGIVKPSEINVLGQNGSTTCAAVVRLGLAFLTHSISVASTLSCILILRY
jgi:hypothetical protein